MNKNNEKFKPLSHRKRIQNFKISSLDMSTIKNGKNNYEEPIAFAIEAMKIIQKKYGWISDTAVKNIANALNVSSNEIEEIATFYSSIFRKPVGRNIIRYCDGIVCYICGYINIKDTLEDLLNIQSGQTTKDHRFTLLPTCCLGNCDKSPLIMINDDIHINVTPDKIHKFLEKYS